MLNPFRYVLNYPARALGVNPPLPLNYTLSLTDRCNSRCKTCRVYEKKHKEMSVTEWQKIFTDIGESPYWVTLSGGEPFLREDIVEIYARLVDTCRPGIVNIPTNGLLTDRIIRSVSEMARIRQETKLVINVSLDHCESYKNDAIRGVTGDWDKAQKTYAGLKSLKHHNLAQGIHTVVSKYNVEDLFLIAQTFMAQTDHFITEIAENREELGNISLNISPSLEEYEHSIRHLQALMRHKKYSGLSKLTKLMRLEYYNHVVRWLSGKKDWECYAGYASCQIAPNGDVWGCCMKADVLGNALERDFRAVWRSDKGNVWRAKNKVCACPLANASYTNMLYDPKTMIKVIRDWKH